MKTVGQKIKEIRLKNSLKQCVFAEKICVTQSHLSNIENDKDYPSKAVIRLVALQFDVDEKTLKDDSNAISS